MFLIDILLLIASKLFTISCISILVENVGLLPIGWCLSFIFLCLCSNFIAIHCVCGVCVPLVTKIWIEALISYQGVCISELVSLVFVLKMFMVLLFENRHII